MFGNAIAVHDEIQRHAILHCTGQFRQIALMRQLPLFLSIIQSGTFVECFGTRTGVLVHPITGIATLDLQATVGRIVGVEIMEVGILVIQSLRIAAAFQLVRCPPISMVRSRCLRIGWWYGWRKGRFGMWWRKRITRWWGCYLYRGRSFGWDDGWCCCRSSSNYCTSCNGWRGGWRNLSSCVRTRRTRCFRTRGRPWNNDCRDCGRSHTRFRRFNR
mmetsp:Transcript_1017/g.1433  ORF Transcript_1017/g.1433 Transcript_1017/m.1433 type:complete len:216 (+) Transcript_1017:717-1364(+)